MTRHALALRLAAALLLAGICLPAASAQAAPGPIESSAPGRIVLQVDDGAVLKTVDGSGGGVAATMPDGSSLLLGSGSGGRGVLYAAKIGLNGALDRAFGRGGVVRITLPAGTTQILQTIPQPDGKLLLVGTKPPAGAGAFSPALLQVTRLNADMTLDTAYGSGGTVVTGIGEGCGACTTGALASDGGLVLTGTTGGIPRPPAPSALHWAVTRLTPVGAIDTGFGTGGIATISTTISTSGFNVGFGPGGSIVVEGQAQASLDGGPTSLVLARLTAAGAPDTSFAGGSPVTLPFASGLLMLVRADGSVLVDGQPERPALTPATLASLGTPSPQYLARYTPAGALDPSFGIAGVLGTGSTYEPSQLLPASGGGTLLVGTFAYGLAPGAGPTPGSIEVRLVTANGTLDPAASRSIEVPFGGGGSSFAVSVHPRSVGSIVQSSFQGDTLVRRADGSYLVGGGVAVSQPTGEGTGFSIGRFAVAALTPSLQPDTAFGGPATALRLSVSVIHQRARTAHDRHGIRVSLKSSAVGLARVTIRHGDRAIAQSLLAVFTTARQTLPVELTTYGNTYLRSHHGIRVSLSAVGRDLLTTSATTTARARLR
jgi:uncharacterized delta-60 repeat protein